MIPRCVTTKSKRCLYIICAVPILCSLYFYGTFYDHWSSTDKNAKIPNREHNPSIERARKLLSNDLIHKVTISGVDVKQRELHVRNRSNVDVNSTCNVPRLVINSSEVSGFFHDLAPIKCDKVETNWASVKDGRFIIDEAAVRQHGGAINCTLERFWRVDDNRLAFDTINITSGEKLTNKSEFFTAQCTAKDGKKWQNLHMTVIPQPETIERLSKIRPAADWSGLNVYFIGFDSVSRMTFERKMKRTYKYLVDEMQSVVLEGYNIVGDGTPQAFIPILTGRTETELPPTRKRDKNAQFVDVYPFIWRNFSQSGYVTLYGEDAAAIGTFTYRLKGFKDQPTDHYTRTFFQRAEKVLKNLKNCIGSEPQHVTWFRYAAEFMTQYPTELPRFLLMHHSLLSHNDVNTIMLADDNVADHLQGLHKAGHFNQSIVIVMADHGHRFAKLRQTHQGQLEERLPFFSIALPKAFRESERGAPAFANLKANAGKLTTPFDIHATLMDILHWPTAAQLGTPQTVDGHRSLSVFRPIPDSRNCGQAGVEPHWCTCLNWEPAMDTPESLNLTKLLTNAVVEVINKQTAPERKLCAPLAVLRIESALRLIPNEAMLSYKKAKDFDGFVPDLGGQTKLAQAHYQIKFRTSPGDALYEATILYDMNDNQVIVDLSAISHVNRYGDRPHCIIDKNYFLATYCVCYDRI